MKPISLFNRLLALLFISGTFIHASPAGASSPSGGPLHLLSDLQLEHASRGIVHTYNQASGLAPVTLETLDPALIPGELQREGTLGMLTGGALQYLGGTEYWRMAVGRQVIIPVMNAAHPLREQFEQQGLSPAGFAELLSGEGGFYFGGYPEAEAMLSDFLGTVPEALPGKGVNDIATLVELLQSDPQAIGFCPISAVTGPEAYTLVQGISLVPIDMNGNGHLEHSENIYRSAADLVRGIAIGKYPRSLTTRIYAVSAEEPSAAEEIAFLEWLASDGQTTLSELGWLGLTALDRPSAINHIGNDRSQLAGQEVAPAATRAVLIIGALLLAILAVALVVFNRISLRPSAPGYITPGPGTPGRAPFSFPAGFFFDTSHTWTYLEKDGRVKVGLDQFLLHVTGPVTRVEMKDPGTVVRKGEPLLSIIQQGKKLVIHAPLTGKVTACNESLRTHPDRINQSPYDQGWIYLVEPERWVSELRQYYLGDTYKEWLRDEMNRLKEFFSRGIALLVGGVPAPVIQDGGEISYGILGEFGPEVWEEFQVRFINRRV